MLEGIPTNIVEIGPWGLLILVVAFNIVALVKGWLVTKGVLDIWVDAYKTTQAARAEDAAQRAEMLEGIKLVVATMSSIKAIADERTKAGDGA